MQDESHVHYEFPDGAFRLFATCIAVRGARMSAIYDLNRMRIVTFPSAYADLLDQLQEHGVATVLAQRAQIGDSLSVVSFVQYLRDEEVATFFTTPEAFPPLSREWNSPCVIDNAIIDVDGRMHDFRRCISELDALGCQLLQVRAFSAGYSAADLDAIVDAAQQTSIRAVEFLLCFRDGAEQELGALARERHIVTRAVLHSAPRTQRVALFQEHELSGGFGQKELELYAKAVTSCEACGHITAAEIRAPSLENFLEYSMHNGCLNRKISIDAEGEIKNCPSFSRSYGNIAATRLENVVKNAEFRRVWDIKKDDIAVCRDCEFRYACSDCRAYTVDDDLFGKPARCGYDPYSGVWKEPERRRRLLCTFAQEEFQ